MKLRGKVAIITGAGRGLGRAAALAMAEEGARVVVMSRTSKEINETARLIGKAALVLKADVSRPQDVRKVVRKALVSFGRVDILMNNAAVLGPVGLTYEIKKKDWDRAMAINLGGAVDFSRAVLPYMVRQGGGKIINVTSGLGEMAMPPFGVYSVAKGALIHLSRIMAEELRARNIQVNGLDPGVMDTRMQDELRALGPMVLGEEAYEEFRAMKERGHLDPPEKAARLAVFLASSASDHMTGENGTESDYRALGYRPNP